MKNPKHQTRNQKKFPIIKLGIGYWSFFRHSGLGIGVFSKGFTPYINFDRRSRFHPKGEEHKSFLQTTTRQLSRGGKRNSQNCITGFTLLEAVLYVGFLGVISVMIVNFMLQISNTYHILRAEREVVSNARLVLERIEKTVAQSSEIYSPTSYFNANLGQLSLLVGDASDPNHPAFYTDFWVDNGRLWTRREGQNAIPVSAASVKIDYFYLESIIQRLDREAVKMTLRVSYNSPINLPIASTTLNATMALRGAY